MIHHDIPDLFCLDIFKMEDDSSNREVEEVFDPKVRTRLGGLGIFLREKVMDQIAEDKILRRQLRKENRGKAAQKTKRVKAPPKK